jgi:PAS domain S-box-containing protein
VENLQDGIVFEDEQRRILYANRRFGELFGIDRPAETLIGLDCSSAALRCGRLFADAEQFARRIDDIITGRRIVTGEELLLADGRVFERDYVPVQTGLNQYGCLWKYRDITKRKRIEKLLLESERRYHDLLDNVRLISVILDATGTLTFCNKYLLELTGWKSEEVIGKNWFDLFVPDPHFRDVFAAGLADRDMPPQFETAMATKRGGERLIQWSNTVLRDLSGSATGMASIGEDVTDRKRMEEELLKVQKLESIGILAGGIAHDFNNLLSAILGNISLARLLLPADHTAARQLARAEEASNLAKELSYRLLTFSKGGEPFRQPVSIEKLTRDAASLALSGANVRAEFLSDGAADGVEVDEGQIKQVINNLLINAKEAMPQGGRVTIRTGRRRVGEQERLPLPPGDYVTITVSDEGVGIPQENLWRIFDPYFTTKEMGSQRGSGLGLAICHSIIRKHDGLITVESAVGKGTTFHVYLPFGRREHAPHAVQTDAAPAPGKRGRVLVMDDEQRVRTVAKEMLEYLGYGAVTASEGAEAVDAYKAAQRTGEPFDVVILDLTVPAGTGGLDTVRMLREIDPAVRAVVSSGYAEDPIMTDSGTYGFAAAIAKPYDVEQLRRTIETVMNVPQ